MVTAFSGNFFIAVFSILWPTIKWFRFFNWTSYFLKFRLKEQTRGWVEFPGNLLFVFLFCFLFRLKRIHIYFLVKIVQFKNRKCFTFPGFHKIFLLAQILEKPHLALDVFLCCEDNFLADRLPNFYWNISFHLPLSFWLLMGIFQCPSTCPFAKFYNFFYFISSNAAEMNNRVSSRFIVISSATTFRQNPSCLCRSNSLRFIVAAYSLNLGRIGLFVPSVPTGSQDGQVWFLTLRFKSRTWNTHKLNSSAIILICLYNQRCEIRIQTKL